MSESEPMGVQRLSAQERLRRLCRGRSFGRPFPRNQFEFSELRAAAIQPVAQHGKADMRKMDADLMRAACLWQRTQQRIARKSLQDFILRDRWACGRVLAPNGLFFAVSRVIAN